MEPFVVGDAKYMYVTEFINGRTRDDTAYANRTRAIAWSRDETQCFVSIFMTPKTELETRQKLKSATRKGVYPRTKHQKYNKLNKVVLLMAVCVDIFIF